MATLATLDDYRRYGRQMIIEGLGLPGQVKLQNASVVVVGAGGLGCPAVQYLAGGGVGRIGVIDHDIVELSNLQRQILHTEGRIGMNKAQSVAIAIKEINSTITVDVMPFYLTTENALSLLAPYDIILDCTDNAPTRYLLSDTAVALTKPLISGAAQKLEGQLCTYNLDNTGPCYRCMFPKPPPAAAAATCEETGILGVVTGIIGNLQALEAIKIITGLNDGPPSLLIFSAMGTPPFRSIKLRARRPDCLACGLRTNQISKTDYVQFCGGARPDWLDEGLKAGEPGLRTWPEDVKRSVDNDKLQATIIDVRSPTEFGICHLPGSINVPLNELHENPTNYVREGKDIIVVCRLGNDSKIGADLIRKSRPDIVVKDMVGGLVAWAQRIDSQFPIY